MRNILIGIDPGAKTGYAEWFNGEFLTLKTTTFWDAILRIDGHHNIKNPIKVYLEQPDLNRSNWTANGFISSAIRNGAIREGVARGLKIARNIGQNLEHANLIKQFCDLIGVECIEVRPNQKSMTKLKAEEFCSITGYTGRTSEHSRDAGMLVFQRRE